MPRASILGIISPHIPINSLTTCCFLLTKNPTASAALGVGGKGLGVGGKGLGVGGKGLGVGSKGLGVGGKGLGLGGKGLGVGGNRRQRIRSRRQEEAKD